MAEQLTGTNGFVARGPRLSVVEDVVVVVRHGLVGELEGPLGGRAVQGHRFTVLAAFSFSFSFIFGLGHRSGDKNHDEHHQQDNRPLDSDKT